MSSVYDSRYTGEEIDEAVRKSLEFDPTTIGTKYLSSSTANPVDLNALTTKGKYTMNYFINGSTTMIKYSPITIDVYYVNSIMYQSVLMGSMLFIRQRVSIDTFTEWAEYDLLANTGNTGATFLPQVNFTNTSTSPILIASVPAGTYVKSCVLNLRQKFDEVTVVSIGTEEDHTAFMSEISIDNFASDNVIYESDACVQVTDAVDVYLYITATSATQGYGNIKLIIN